MFVRVLNTLLCTDDNIYLPSRFAFQLISLARSNTLYTLLSFDSPTFSIKLITQISFKHHSFAILFSYSLDWNIEILLKNFIWNNYGGILSYYSFLSLQEIQKGDITLNRSSCLVVFCKKVFLKISQNSQQNTCARVIF